MEPRPNVCWTFQSMAFRKVLKAQVTFSAAHGIW